MKKYKNIFIKHGFTVIELVVIMAVMAILVFLGSMGYKGYTKQAQLTRLQFDSRLLSDACQRFYVDNGDYPRLVDTPYTSDQVNAFASKVYDQKGAVISVDSSGSYYDLDFSKLKKYVSIKEDYTNFLLQNPAGDIYFLEPSTNSRLPENASLKPAAPMLTVDVTNNPPKYNVVYPSGVTPQNTEYQLDEGVVVTSAPVDLLSAGNHNMKVRYEYNNNYSDWVSVDFIIVNGVKQISAGYDFTIALMQDGTLKSWGQNLYGQLGIASNYKTNNPVAIPTTIPNLTGVKQVATGSNFSIALMQDGSVKAWGINYGGQLGSTLNTGTLNPVLTPTTIQNLTGVTQIAAGYDSAAALLQDGTVKSWGVNLYGQLGNSTNILNGNPNPTPTTIVGLSGVKQITEGYGHAAAVMQDGTVKAWGNNYYGQIGTIANIGTANPNQVPVNIAGLTGVKQVAAGNSYTLALMEDGTVKAIGLNNYGQLGNNINIGTTNANITPTIVSGLTGVTQISAGLNHTLALMSDGSVKSWGLNYYGNLGITTNIGTFAPNSTPVTIPNLSGVKLISAGDYHSVVLMQDATVKAFGYNSFGQLGNTTNNGTNNPNPTPTTIAGL